MPTLNPDYINELKALFENSPFPHHMSMKMVSIDFDMAEIEIALNKNHLQPFGIVHGGVFATLIDTATFWASYLRSPQDACLVNIDLKLNYLKPAHKGRLRAKGVCLQSGRSLSYAEASVVDENGRTAAHGTSTLMIVPGNGIQLNTSKFLHGDQI